MSDSHYTYSNTNTTTTSHPERLAGGAPPSAVATAQQGAFGAWTSIMLGANNNTTPPSCQFRDYDSSNITSTPSVPPPGLLNLGDTCYLNSVVQVLYHTPAFRRAILEYEAPHNITSTATQEVRNAHDVSLELKRLFRALESDHPTRRDWVQPSDLVDMLRDKTREFDFVADGQQDAHEFLRFLLENVSTAFDDIIDSSSSKKKKRSAEDDVLSGSSSGSSQRPKKRPRSSPNGTSSSSASGSVSALTNLTKNIKNRFQLRKKAREETVIDGSDTPPPGSSGTENTKAGTSSTPVKNKRSKSKNDAMLQYESEKEEEIDRNVVRRIFRGESVTSTRCCECETASNRPEAFLDLSVPVTVGQSLPTLLDNMAAGDMLNGNNKYACSQCHTKTEAERRFYLSQLPKVVTIHLKLFQYTQYAYSMTGSGGKIPVATPAPMRMRFDQWCTKKARQENKDQNKEYSLTGIIVHTGGCSTSGHYYSYVYNKNRKRWHRCDDSKVEDVTEEEIENRLFYSCAKSKETGYLLFYTMDNNSNNNGEYEEE